MQEPQQRFFQENFAPVNRSAILGTLIAGLGLFFLPILEIKPDLINSGVTVRLMEIEGDLRFIAFFVLCLAPLAIAFDQKQDKRAGLLVGLGTIILVGSMLMPAIYAGDALAPLESPADATEEEALEAQQAREAFFDYLPADRLEFANPRALPTGGILAAFLGGYIILFAGIRDLQQSGQSRSTMIFAMLIAPLLIIFLFVDKHLESYSVVEEYRTRGEELKVFFFEHLAYVIVAILAGLVIGIGQGLWAARDERMAPVILYSVGIIQTIPSLALFGLLLVPLARLGDRSLPDVLPDFLVLMGVATFFVSILMTFNRYRDRFEYYGRTGITIGQQIGVLITVIAAIALALPLGIFTIIFVGFGFRIVRIMLINDQFGATIGLMNILIIALAGLWAIQRRVRNKTSRKRLGYLRLVLIIILLNTIGTMLVDATRVQLQRISLSSQLDFSFADVPVFGSLIDSIFGTIPLNMNWLEPLFLLIVFITVLAILGMSGILERMSRYILYVDADQKRSDAIMYGVGGVVFLWLSYLQYQDNQSVKDFFDSSSLSPLLIPIFTVTLVGLCVFAFVTSMSGDKRSRPHQMAYQLMNNIKPIRRYLSLTMLIGLGLIGLVGIVAFTVTYKEATVRDLGASGIGVAPSIIALTLYSLLPLVRNTYAGLKNVDPAIIDAGQGVGMTPTQIFFKIELPLAIPVIIAGVRNAVVALVGIATIAAIIGGGGLGKIVLQGIDNATVDQILLGAIPAVIMAFGLDWLVRIVEILITSPGIRQLQS